MLGIRVLLPPLSALLVAFAAERGNALPPPLPVGEAFTLEAAPDEAGLTLTWSIDRQTRAPPARVAKAVARLAVLDWEGVGDSQGEPLALSSSGIDALLEVWPVFEAFQSQYVARGLMLDAEKNVFAPSPTGASAGATAIARPVADPALTVRQN